MPSQTSFAGADFVTSRALLRDDEVAYSSNIDYSVIPGAAAVRRGSVRVIKPGTAAVDMLFRHYNNASLGASPWYTADAAGVVRRITGGFGAPSASNIITGGNTDENDLSVAVSYRDDVFIASGTVAKRDDGTTTREWVPPAPGTAVTLATATLAPLAVLTSTNTWTAVEASDAPSTDVGTATADTNEASLRITFEQAPNVTNLNTNGGVTIGDAGVHSIDLAFDEPKFLTRVVMEYSIGDATFTNKLTAQLDAVQYSQAISDAGELIDGVRESANGVPADSSNRATARSLVRQALRPPRAQAAVAPDSFATWSVAAPQFELVGRSATNVFADVQACRLVIEASGPLTAKARDWVVQGAETYPLHDPKLGYTYWETFARVETIGGEEVIVDESAPSPASARQRINNGRIIVTSPNASPGEGMTHRVLYRQGGYLADPYAISTHSVGTATWTDTMWDIEALLFSNTLEGGIRATFPQAARAAAVYVSRMFVGYDNRLIWSLPGRPGTFPAASETEVSHTADRIQKLFTVGDRLVIVNRDSVYEMIGGSFEGIEADWTLGRTESQGSIAPRATVMTPYGITLVRDDGLFLYQPGAGRDRPLDWAMAKIGDIFKGNGAFDPAQVKGRIGDGINQSAMQHCVAAYHDDKLYFGFPSGSATRASLFVVCDFKTQRCAVFSFPWNVRTMLADRSGNALLVGTTDGALMRLNQGHQDADSAGVAASIVWNLGSRRWTLPGETRGQIVSFENEGQMDGTAHAVYDGTATDTVGTLTASNRAWTTFGLDGTAGQSVEFFLYGTQNGGDQGVLRGINWEGDTDPPAVEYWRSDDDDGGWPCEKRWNVLAADISVAGTATVTAVTYIDGAAVATNTVVGPVARTLHHFSLPNNTVGDIAYTVVTGGPFKRWRTLHLAEREPCRVTLWRTEEDSGEERIFDAINADLDCNGEPVTSVVYVDNVAVTTATFSGSGRQSYVGSLPVETYGRSIYAVHEGTAFKHYRTWWDQRLEPDRYTTYVTPRRSGEEHWWRAVNADVDLLGGTATCTTYIDNVAVDTEVLTGNGRESYSWSLPADTYGRTAYTRWTMTGAGRLKMYGSPGPGQGGDVWYDATPEPDRLASVQWGPQVWPSEQRLRTLVSELNPLGTATAVVYADGVAITTATLTGNRRTTYETTLELDGSNETRFAREVAVTYTGASLKHYNTVVEAEPQPFGKTQWVVDYTKAGGASRLDMLRAFSMDIEAVSGTATVTSIWEADGTAYGTSTLTCSTREWQDKLPVPPGMRGYLFRQRVTASAAVQVHASAIDAIQYGVKGAVRRSYAGTPR